MKTGNTFVFCISLVLVAVFFLGCENTGGNLSRLDCSGVGLEAAYPLWSSSHSNAQVVLTFSNRTARAGMVVLPRALNEEDSSFGSSNKPTLLLVAKDLLSKNEERFILTTLIKLKSENPKQLSLKPHQTAQVSYELGSFYGWGSSGPDSWGSMVEHLWPGEREIAFYAVIAYSENELTNRQMLQSPPVVLKCAFSPGLFSRSVESTGSPLSTNTVVPP